MICPKVKLAATSPTPRATIGRIDFMNYMFGSSFGNVSTIIGTRSPIYMAKEMPDQANYGVTNRILWSLTIMPT